jgi:hypothetical protein
MKVIFVGMSFPEWLSLYRYYSFSGSLGIAVITARCGGMKGDKIRVGGAL